MDPLGALGLILQLARALPLRDLLRAAAGRPPLEAIIRPNSVIAGHYAWTALRADQLAPSPTIDQLNAAAARGAPIVPTTIVVAPRNMLGAQPGPIRLRELTFWLRDYAPTPELADYALLVDNIPSAGPTARADAHIPTHGAPQPASTGAALSHAGGGWRHRTLRGCRP